MNKLTSLLGMAVIIAASVTVFTHDRSWTEVALVIPSASVLLLVENEKAMEALKAVKK